MKKNKTNEFFKTHFSARRIAAMALFTALSYIVGMFEFPIFPATTMLELDFSSVFILLAVFMFGPLEGVIVCVIKELLHIPIGSTGGIGELANIIMTLSYLIIPSIVYKYNKKLPIVILSLVLATLFSTLISFLVNRFINFPLYGDTQLTFFNSVKFFIIGFNLIKWSAISIVTMLIYKPLQRLFSRQSL